MNVKDLLTEQETAEILDISAATLRLWLQKGRIPYYRMGKKVRLDRQDVEAFIQGSRVEVA
jgi:putative molybdopterin biosynthesis protein